MLFLLDTNAFSDLMRQQIAITSRMNALPAGDVVVTCSIVRGEILYGIQRLPPGKKRQEFERQSTALLPIVSCQAVPAAAGDHYALIKLASQQSGLTLGDNDAWIAATAIALGATLVTRDKDFSQIAGLTVQDWTV